MLRAAVLALLLLAVACDQGPVPSNRLVVEFTQRRGAMVQIADGLRSLREVGISALWVDRSSTVHFLAQDTALTLDEAQRRASEGLDSVLAALATLAPRHVLNATLGDDDAFICITWTAGVPAGGGYARVGTGGQAGLRLRAGIDWLRPIPADSTWFTWGT